jgi:hypothetical protein
MQIQIIPSLQSPVTSFDNFFYLREKPFVFRIAVENGGTPGFAQKP